MKRKKKLFNPIFSNIPKVHIKHKNIFIIKQMQNEYAYQR